MKARVIRDDLCEDIRKGDIVELVPEYSYMIGTDERIKEYFDVRSGEIVIKKTVKVNNKKSNLAIIKCKRKDVDIIKG
ncbi:hypothetical protein [Clostridium hydrogeniformans]|uniref:hypothetical protein n=1 Tax=Clostridium hydrogeniformans TaxID=349933 RepID=UPI0004899794|nr:hypothetical protein [Clostridium hydrogeniformans]